MTGDPQNPRSGEVEAILLSAHDPCVDLQKDLYYAAQAFLESALFYRQDLDIPDYLVEKLKVAKVTMDRAKEKLGV